MLKLVIEFCLSDLHSVLISCTWILINDSSLQKTSPDFDPAAFYHFSTEVSAQASVLATHQQQLNRLTSVTEELVKTLQALHLPALLLHLSIHLLPTPLSPPPALVSPSRRSLMDLQPNVRASYFNAQCLLTNNPCCTPQTRPASHSCVRFSRGERWIGPPRCGVRIDPPSHHLGHLFNVSRRCSSTLLEEGSG